MNGKERQRGLPECFCVGTVRLILGAILLFLTVLSAAVTCRVYGGAEIVEYERDMPLIHILFLVAVLAAAAALPLMHKICRKRRFFSDREEGGENSRGVQKTEGSERVWASELCRTSRMTREKRYVRILIAVAGFYLVWLLAMLIWGGSDSRMSMASARLLLSGDTSPWEPCTFLYGGGPAGYAYTYPVQNGLILYMVPAAFLFREAAPYVLQAFNIGFFFLGVLCLGKMLTACCGSREYSDRRHMVLLMCVFLPFSFYFLFVYGTMPGFGLACLGMERAQRYAGEGRKRDIWIGAAAICGAVLLKSNYLIVLVGIVLYLMARGLFDRKIKTAAAALVVIAVYIIGSRGMNTGLSLLTGHPTSGGIPMIAWAEMGLQEGKRGPGWYNGYHVRIFTENEGDAERTKERAKQDLRQTAEEFLSDPSSAADFFVRKTESIWAEPTFQSLWIQEIGGESWLIPGIADSLLKKGGLLNMMYVGAANMLQTLIYAGAFLWILLGRRQMSWESLLPGMIVIGGFLFHLVWEAKGQYTVFYFFLLIPYAFWGIREAAHRIRHALYRRLSFS